MFSKVKNLFLKLYNDKRIRFLFVGCLNTIVGTGITLICYLAMGYGIFEQSNVTDLQNFIATVIGYAVGTVHSYIWNKFFTFKSKEKSVWVITISAMTAISPSCMPPSGDATATEIPDSDIYATQSL